MTLHNTSIITHTHTHIVGRSDRGERGGKGVERERGKGIERKRGKRKGKGIERGKR